MFQGRGLEGVYGAARRTTLIADARAEKAGSNRRMISAFDNEEKNNGPTTQR